jgi:hypothetical protein
MGYTVDKSGVGVAKVLKLVGLPQGKILVQFAAGQPGLRILIIANPDPAPHQSDANLRTLFYRPSTAPF